MLENVIPFRSSADPAPNDAAAIEKAENERAVLGAMIVNETASDILRVLRAEHFAFPVHGRIYTHVQAMIERHGRIDLRLLRENIGAEPALEPTGGTGKYLGILIKDATAATFAPVFARKIVDAWMGREIDAALEEARSAGLPPAELAACIDAQLRRITADVGSEDGFLTMNSMRPETLTDYLVKGLLPQRGMTVIYGAPGSGKTFFALRLGLSVASGALFFGLKTQKRAVVYIAAEAGRSIVNRVCAAKTEFPADTQFYALTSPIDLCSNGTDVDRLVRMIKRLGVPVGLIIIDTLSRVMAGGNENAPDDMGALVANCDRLRAETETALVLVHHAGKDAAKGARGHSLLLAATDTEIEVTQDESKLCTARVTKQRDLPVDGMFCFRLEQVEIGRDDEGDAITSCTVVEANPNESARIHPKPPPPVAQKFLSALHDALADPGAVIHKICGRNAITQDAWKRECRRLGLLDEAKPASDRGLFSKYRLMLIAGNAIAVNSEYVWPL